MFEKILNFAENVWDCITDLGAVEICGGLAVLLAFASIILKFFGL